jgi:hypothetical protein
MSMRVRHIPTPNGLRRAGPFELVVILVVLALLGCTPASAPSRSGSPGVSSSPSVSASSSASAATPSPLPSVPASASPSTAPTSFAWAARPDAFAGAAGASLVSVASGAAGLVALSVRYQEDGTPKSRLWRSPDGVRWTRLDLAGLPDVPVINAVWGAGGAYWLTEWGGQASERGSLWRSIDGRAWQRSIGLDRDLEIWSVGDGCQASTASSSDSCPLFVTGIEGVDGAIWRSTDDGTTWAKATLKDATGWEGVQDAAPVEVRGVVATSNGLLAFGNGLPKASDTSGFLQSRFWRSNDGGVTWSRLRNEAPFSDLLVHDLVASGRAVAAVGGGSMTRGAVALTSSDGGGTWSRSVIPDSEAEPGDLAQVFVAGTGLVGLGFSKPAQVDTFPVREFLWTSDDGGASWRTGPAGDLDGGVVNDVVRVDDKVVAVGRGWTTDETGSWEAPFGPAVWILPT